jgi:hypothetical protein
LEVKLSSCTRSPNLYVSAATSTGRSRLAASMATAAAPQRAITVPLDSTALAPSTTLLTSCAAQA